MKHCNKCDTDKPINEFARRSKNDAALKSRCKTCIAKAARERK
jgi:hypothetical protein